MSTQTTPVHSHAYERDPHTVAINTGEDEHHEKKSVLKKVKDKAKKIKETLIKHSREHEHDHDHARGLDEEEDDNEIEQEPEVHGAPMYESEASRKLVSGKEGISGPAATNLGQNWLLEEDPNAPKNTPESFSPGNYQTKVPDPTGTVREEADMGTIIRSLGKMEVTDEQKSFTGSHDQFSPDSAPTETKSIPESLNWGETDVHLQQERHSEDPTNRKSYTEKISSATSVIADRAISAKNVVTSTVTEKLAPVVTEKLEPVYQKVTEAGSTVVSKVKGGTGTETVSRVKGPDKGVSVKEYIAEKLRPSEEDRALSEVISEVLHKRKEEPEKAHQSLGELTSEAVHKHKEEPKKDQSVMGKVTDSPEVAERLGSDECSGTGLGINNEAVGKGVVSKIKGAVGSWFGKEGESRTSQASQVASHGVSEGDERSSTTATAASSAKEVGHGHNE